ncbi:MAG: acyltransferase [Acholeplasmatales bacterium]|nr:acyltransferase [Acholeplasmatales bacterium]
MENQVVNNTKRKSNFELLRIISILFIIGHHFAIHGVHIFNSGAYENASLVNRAFVDLMLPGGFVGVALFFMITGYFFIDNNRIKILKYIIEAIFYGLVIFILLIIINLTGYQYPELSSLQKTQVVMAMIFNPATSYAWWFLCSYILLILMSPVINKLFNKLDKKGYLILLILFWILVYSIDKFSSSYYYNLTRGVMFYLIGGFIKKYYVNGVCNCWYKMMLLLVAFFVGWVSFAFGEYYYYNVSIDGFNVILKNSEYLSLIESSILTPICAISLFLFFTSFSFYSKTINFVAKTTFGIYLLHDSYISRHFIWHLLLGDGTIITKAIFPLYGLFCVLLAFIVCMLIDIFRMLFIEKHLLKLATKIVDDFSKKHVVDEE